MSRSTQSGDDEELIMRKAKECVEYIYTCVLAERKCVVRKLDLNKNVIKEYSRHFKPIFAQAKTFLIDVFGLVLVDLDGQKGERFGVRSKFEYNSELHKSDMREEFKHLREFTNDLSGEPDREYEEQVKYSMLMISLSLILMNNNEIEASLFWESLRKLDINKDEKRHKYLGDVSKLFTVDFVKDGYLEYEQVTVDPPVHKFKWGYRSKVEISKMNVLKFVCQIYGGEEACNPEDFVAQYSDAKKKDQFSEDADDNDENMLDNTTVPVVHATQNQRTQNATTSDLYSQDQAAQGTQRKHPFSQRLR